MFKLTEGQASFLKEVFEESNAHLRETDRKALIVTGVYIGFFSVFLTTLGAPQSPAWHEVLVQGFFLLVGTSVYSLQRWYRAWKEHYAGVCRNIRQQFIDTPSLVDLSNCLPNWMLDNFRQTWLSVDQVFNYLVLITNTITVGIIASEVLNLMGGNSASIVLVVMGVGLYALLVGVIWRHVHRDKLNHI